MTTYSLGENLLLGLLVLGVVFWMNSGIKASMKKSHTAHAEWQALLIPIGFVVLFVIFLITMV